MLQGDLGIVAKARQLRKDMTLPEKMMWQHLRGNPEGMKFRRQHPSGPYVADFYCHKAGLVIEVDGITHDMGKNPVRDNKRDAWFADHDIEVMRVSAAAVLKDAIGTCQSILDYAIDKTVKGTK